MKKNILLITLLLLLTGCKNELVCTSTTQEENYLSEQKITFEVKDNKVSHAITKYTMSFEDEETAEMYAEVFKSLDDDHEIVIDKNKIELKSEKKYEEYDQTKEEVKKEFEKNGYSCK